MRLTGSPKHKLISAFLLAICLPVNVPVSSEASTYSSDRIGVSAVESAAKFIHERSGVSLSTEVKARLSVLEQQALDGVIHRVGIHDLAAIVTDVLMDRLSSLTDPEIQEAARTFRGDPDPKYDYILLSWDGKHMSTRREFVAALKSFRAKSRERDPIFRSMLRRFIEGNDKGEGLSGRVKTYSKTLPEFLTAPDGGLTPLQAVLIIYSLASDDNLNASTSGLRAEMAHQHQTIGGTRFPDPDGRYPFGAHGYLFPTPLHLVFNDKIVNKLLDQLEKKTRTSGS